LGLVAGAVTGCEDAPPPPTDPKAIEAAPWIAQVRSTDMVKREEAINRLAKIDHPCVVEPLLAVARYDVWLGLRARALRALGRPEVLKDPKCVLEFLVSRDDEMRLAACEVLSRLKSPEAEGALAGCIQDPTAFVRLAAVQALGQLGPKGLARLDKVLKEGAVEEQVAVIDAFGRTGDAKRMPVLVAALSFDNDGVRRTAAEALGRLGDAQAVKPLMGLVRDPLSKARIAEFEARLGKKPTRADSDAMKTLLDLEMLRNNERPKTNPRASLTEGNYQPMFRRLLDRQREDAARAIREVAIESIRKAGGEAGVTALAELLGEKDESAASVVAKAMASSGESTELLYAIVNDTRRPAQARIRAVEALMADRRPTTQEGAEHQLSRILREVDSGQPTTATARTLFIQTVPGTSRFVKVVTPLDDRLREALISRMTDRDPLFLVFCAKTLAVRKLPEAIEPLVGLLDNPDPAIQADAVEAVANYRDPRPAAKLLAILKNPKAESYHKEAITALGGCGGKEAVEPLLAIATDMENPLMVPAIEAIGKIGHPSAGKRLLELYRKIQAMPALARGPGSRPATMAEQVGRIQTIKSRLITSLGQVKATEAVPMLIAMVKESMNGKGGHEAMAALGDIGDRSAVPVIIDRLRNAPHDTRTHSAPVNRTTRAGMGALAKLGDPRGVEVMAYYLKNPPEDPQDPVVEHAREGLAQMKSPEAAEALVGLLADTKLDPGIKESEIGPALAEVGLPAKGPLLKLLAESPAVDGQATQDPGIYAAQLLAVLGKPALPDMMAIAQRTKQRHVLGRVIEGVKRIDDDEAVAGLGLIVKTNTDSLVRQWAVVALGGMKRKAAIPLLESAAKDPDTEVSKWAETSLKALRTN
jgi:HEAT repeat protein